MLTDGRTDGRTNERTNERTDGRTDGRTEIWTPISHPAISRCDNNQRENTQARVMVLVHDTSSLRGLQVYQVSLKNI